jgi:streptogramin lyase
VKKLNTVVGMLAISLMAASASAGMLNGTVKDADGEPMNGVMVRLTSTDDVSESVFTNASGQYTITTKLEGEISVRLRTPYYRDVNTWIELGPTLNLEENMMMEAMTSETEISDSLPAAYHFGNLPFEEGDDKDFNRHQFQRDCLSCHQLGNSFTRVPRTAKNWTGTVKRMHMYIGNFDDKLIDRRSEIFAAGFDGKPLKVRPEFPVDEALATAKIYEYPLLQQGVPHDTIVHPDSGLMYTVDQALHHMSITDPVSGLTRYVPQKDSEASKYYTAAPSEKKTKNFSGEADEGLGGLAQGDGPHSLALGLDGKYYVTNTGTTSIGVFNPETNLWEPSHKLPDVYKGRYPHTIRVSKSGTVWFTMAGAEHVGRLDPVTGKFDIIALPNVVAGGISGGTQPYGIDISPTDDAMWYGRLFGDKIGRVDPVTFHVTEFDSPVRGPRRMYFDKKGMLWVTGYSEGQLARIDVNNWFHSKVYDMPEFAPGYRPAPYALAIHPETQDIWLNENMTDRFYRFIQDEERFVVYPVPLSNTYTRDTSFTPDGKICTSNNPLPAAALEGGRLQIFCIDTEV